MVPVVIHQPIRPTRDKKMIYCTYISLIQWIYMFPNEYITLTIVFELVIESASIYKGL
jgi:hypothetical protein